jgi:hypothetical protein
VGGRGGGGPEEGRGSNGLESPIYDAGVAHIDFQTTAES